MSAQHGGAHPSDRLYNGQVADFGEALELVEAEFAVERAMLLRSEPDAQQTEDLGRMDAALAQIDYALGHAGKVWREEQGAARRRTVERLRADALAAEAAHDDEASRWLGLLATALERGDYSGLAI